MEAQYTKAYSGHTYEGVLVRFAAAKGIISEVQAGAIGLGIGEWPEGARDRAAACWVEPKEE